MSIQPALISYRRRYLHHNDAAIDFLHARKSQFTNLGVETQPIIGRCCPDASDEAG